MEKKEEKYLEEKMINIRATIAGVMMGANAFGFDISLVDKATEAVEKIVRQVYKHGKNPR